jgi:transposase-like protein
MGKIRRKYDADFKRQIVALVESGSVSQSQIARDHQIAGSLVGRWREQLRDGTLKDQPSARERQLEADNERLRAKIGEQVMQIDLLKKLQIYAERRRNAGTSVTTGTNGNPPPKVAR